MSHVFVGTNLEVTLVDKLIGIPVYRFKPQNGGWGVSLFDTFPKLPIIQPSGESHFWFSLGNPSIVWWRGSEHGSSGYGVSIRIGNEWKNWYNSYSNSCYKTSLIVGPEQLKAIGILHIFSITVDSSGINVVLTDGKTGTAADIVLSQSVTTDLRQDLISGFKKLYQGDTMIEELDKH